MEKQLLSRDEFREAVFKRDKNKCVNCGDPKQDAHHLIERRLFTEDFEKGGYFLDNGATVCGPCHMLAEQTLLSPEILREKAGITTVVLPDHMYADNEYTKWGDIIRANGTRSRGELFEDESVQKVLQSGGVIHLYSDYVKYPRTFHVPWSPNMTKDDKMMPNAKVFEGQEVVATIKLDGENTTMYRDYIHARSIDGDSHPSQTYVRNLHSRIAHEIIPPLSRLCGENVYAKHSIAYSNLEDYFYVFSFWDTKNNCLSWDETLEYAALFELPVVPVFYRGIYDEKTIRQIYQENWESDHEGYVIRNVNSFEYKNFKHNVAKYVRKGHVQKAVHHWRANWYNSPDHVNKRLVAITN